MKSAIPRILLVDDNLEIHNDFRKIFKKNSGPTELDELEAAVFDTRAREPGFECAIDFASQGIEALAMVRRAKAEGRPYLLAFVDVRMPPGWDGVQTIAEIRKVEPEMEFAICTSYSDYTPVEASQKVGLSNGLLFIIKPFDVSIVRQLAQTLTSQATATRQRAG